MLQDTCCLGFLHSVIENYSDKDATDVIVAIIYIIIIDHPQ